MRTTFIIQALAADAALHEQRMRAEQEARAHEAALAQAAREQEQMRRDQVSYRIPSTVTRT